MDRSQFQVFAGSRGRGLSRRAFLLTGDIARAGRLLDAVLSKAFARAGELDAPGLEALVRERMERAAGSWWWRLQAYGIDQRAVLPATEDVPSAGSEALEEAVFAAVLRRLSPLDRRRLCHALEDGAELPEDLADRVEATAAGLVDVRTTYERMAPRIPDLVEASEASEASETSVATGRRKGRRPVAVVGALTAGLLLTVWIAWTGPDVPDRDEDGEIDGTASVGTLPSIHADEWLADGRSRPVAEAGETDTTLPSGTWLALRCARRTPGCGLTLRREDGETLELDDLNPRLAAALGRKGADHPRGLAWSPDGRMLGLATAAGTYEIWDVFRDTVFTMPRLPKGERWVPVGWTEPARDLILAKEVRGTVREFATFDGAGLDPAPVALPAPERRRVVGLDFPLEGVHEVEVVAPVRSGRPVHRLVVEILTLGREDTPEALGDIVESAAKTWDATGLLEPTETLVGPEGVPEFLDVHGPESPPATWLTIFERRNGALVPSGALARTETRRGARLFRLDGAQTKASAEATYHGPLDHGSILVGVRGAAGTPSPFRVYPGGAHALDADLAGASTVLLPGSILRR